jgi:alpha-tubulin suppressor-like RCC1 family protein
MALTKVNEDYKVYSWGNGLDGKLGIGSHENQNTPQLVKT